MNLRDNKEENKVILAYITVCVVWGSTYAAIRVGVSEFPPFLFIGMRYLVAGSLIMLYARLKGLEYPGSMADVRRLSIVGLLLLLGGNGFVAWAEQWVHSGAASMVIATGPLFMAILESMLPGSRSLGLMGWLGMLVGFGGVVLLVFFGSGIGAIDAGGMAGLLAGTLCWAVGSVYSKRNKPGGSIVTHIGIQMLAGGIGLTAAGLLSGEAARVHFSARGIWALLYLIFIGSLIGYSCYIYVLQKWPAARAGTYAYVNPVVAVLIGAVLLNEPVSGGVILSMVVILGGVVLVQVARGPKILGEKSRNICIKEENICE